MVVVLPSGFSDKVIDFQLPVNVGFRSKMMLCIGKPHNQFSRREFRLLQCKTAIRCFALSGVQFQIRRGLGKRSTKNSTPPIRYYYTIDRCGAGNARLVASLLGRLLRLFNQLYDFQVLGCGISRSIYSQSSITLF